MASIPGSIPSTGFLAPTDSNDRYPVTDAIYGIDGLRNVESYDKRNDIPVERRRAGMVVGTPDGKYWRLRPESLSTWVESDALDAAANDNWELMISTSNGVMIGVGLKNVIEAADDITIPENFQYLVYGDLTIIGTLTNNGQLIIVNGALVMDPDGTFNNNGAVILETLQTGIAPLKKYKSTFTVTGPGTVTITHNLATTDIIASVILGTDMVDAMITIVDANTITIYTEVTLTAARINIVGL